MVIAIICLVFGVLGIIGAIAGEMSPDDLMQMTFWILIAGGIIGICNRLDKIIRILGERVEK